MLRVGGPEKWTRNRCIEKQKIYTYYLQLSDLDGGATVFPNQGFATFPKKGSLAFWYNLETNGEKSLASLHGACPSLYGIKWGMVEYILYFLSKKHFLTKRIYFYFMFQYLINGFGKDLNCLQGHVLFLN